MGVVMPLKCVLEFFKHPIKLYILPSTINH
jgi:hypothetical protein